MGNFPHYCMLTLTPDSSEMTHSLTVYDINASEMNRKL